VDEQNHPNPGIAVAPTERGLLLSVP